MTTLAVLLPCLAAIFAMSGCFNTWNYNNYKTEICKSYDTFFLSKSSSLSLLHGRSWEALRWWNPEGPKGGQQTQGQSKPDNHDGDEEDCEDDDDDDDDDDGDDDDDDYEGEEDFDDDVVGDLESNAVEPAVVSQVLLVEVRVWLVLIGISKMVMMMMVKIVYLDDPDPDDHDGQDDHDHDHHDSLSRWWWW